MKKKVLIMGADGSGKTALLKALALANSENIVTIAMPPSHGPSEKMIVADFGGGPIGVLSPQDIANQKFDELCKAMESLSMQTSSASEAAYELGKIGDKIEFHRPVKIHPKHQKNNKYNKFHK